MDGSDDYAGAEASEARPRRRLRSGVLWLFTGFSAFLALVIALDWLQAVGTYLWEETTCSIEQSSVIERPESDEFEFVVSYRYHVRGEEFVSDEYRHGYTGSTSASDSYRLAERYAAGESVPCWIDPDTPWRAYLKRANLWRGLFILVPLVFVAIGLGVLHILKVLQRQPATPGGSAAAAVTPLKGATFMALFFGLFFLVGFGLLVPFFLWPALQVVEARSWEAVPCEILSSGVRSHSGDDSTTYSVEAVYRYRIDGREYTGHRYQFMSGSSSGYDSKAQAAAKIPAGAEAECYVDPDDPYEAVIHRGFGVNFLFGLVPLLFALVGAGGLSFALHLARAAKRDAARPSWPAGEAGSFAPARDDTASISLEPHMGRLTRVAIAAFLALFWNGIVSAFVWQLIKGWREGDFDWFLALFLTPFVLVGLLLLIGVVYSLLAIVNPRPRLRLSPGVLRAGESSQLDWSFRFAASRVRGLKIWLEATKTTITTSDSSVSAQTASLRRIDILERDLDPSLEFGSTMVQVPRDIEPTDEGLAGVSWKLKLQGRIDYWPDVNEEYEIRVVNDRK